MGKIDASRANESNIRRQQKQSEMDDYAYQRTMRQDGEMDALRNVYKNSVGQDGSFDEQKLLGDMLRTNPEIGLKLKADMEKRDLERNKLKNDNRTSELSYKVEQSKYFRDRFANVIDQESYDGILNEGRQMGAGWVQNAPAEYNPEFIKSNAMNADAFVKQNTEGLKAPNTRNVRIGNQQVTQEWNPTTGQWLEVGRGDAFSPSTSVDNAAPVSVIDQATGKPTYVSRKDAIGKMPYTAADDAKKSAADAKQLEKDSGKDSLETSILTLRSAYDSLSKGSGIVDTTKSSLSNIGASISASGLGQALGGSVGTENQTQRDIIEQSRPALLSAIMKATGMSAKQMDSNAELKLWLATATDPKKSLQANKIALDNIEKKFINNSIQKPPSNAYTSKVPPKAYPNAKYLADPQGNMHWYVKGANGKAQMVTQ